MDSKKQPWEMPEFRPLRMLRLREVLELTGMSKTPWERAVRAGLAPSRVHLGPNTSRWRAVDIDAFLGNASGGTLAPKLLSACEVAGLLGVSVAAWREGVREGIAPRGFDLGTTTQRWRAVDIAAFIGERSAA